MVLSKFKIPFIFIASIIIILMSCTTLTVPTVKPDTNLKPNIKFKLIPDRQTYTYDGEFDPAVFFSWEIVKKGICTSGHWHFWLKNPNENSDVKIVETLNISANGSKMTLIAYRYFANSIEYVFVLDGNSGHYKQVQPKPIDKSMGI